MARWPIVWRRYSGRGNSWRGTKKCDKFGRQRTILWPTLRRISTNLSPVFLNFKILSKFENVFIFDFQKFSKIKIYIPWLEAARLRGSGLKPTATPPRRTSGRPHGSCGVLTEQPFSRTVLGFEFVAFHRSFFCIWICWNQIWDFIPSQKKNNSQTPGKKCIRFFPTQIGFTWNLFTGRFHLILCCFFALKRKTHSRQLFIWPLRLEEIFWLMNLWLENISSSFLSLFIVCGLLNAICISDRKIRAAKCSRVKTLKEYIK